MRLRASVTTAALTITGLLAGASAAQAVSFVDLPKTARLDEASNTVILKYRYACDPLPFPEGAIFRNVGVAQPGAFSRVLQEWRPEESSRFQCDGRAHKITELFPSEEGTPWHPGDLFGEALIQGVLGGTIVYEDTDTAVIRLR